MRQKKYLEIGGCIKGYRDATTIKGKLTKFKQCIQEINNLKDWIKNDENIKNGKEIENILFKSEFWKIANDIANTDKHYKLNKNLKTIDDFIEIKTTNDLILKQTNKKLELEKDLVNTHNSQTEEYKYIAITTVNIGAYELLNKCLEEIHELILHRL